MLRDARGKGIGWNDYIVLSCEKVSFYDKIEVTDRDGKREWRRTD